MVDPHPQQPLEMILVRQLAGQSDVAMLVVGLGGEGLDLNDAARGLWAFGDEHGELTLADLFVSGDDRAGVEPFDAALRQGRPAHAAPGGKDRPECVPAARGHGRPRAPPRRPHCGMLVIVWAPPATFMTIRRRPPFASPGTWPSPQSVMVLMLRVARLSRRCIASFVTKIDERRAGPVVRAAQLRQAIGGRRTGRRRGRSTQRVDLTAPPAAPVASIGLPVEDERAMAVRRRQRPQAQGAVHGPVFFPPSPGMTALFHAGTARITATLRVRPHFGVPSVPIGPVWSTAP